MAKAIREITVINTVVQQPILATEEAAPGVTELRAGTVAEGGAIMPISRISTGVNTAVREVGMGEDTETRKRMIPGLALLKAMEGVTFSFVMRLSVFGDRSDTAFSYSSVLFEIALFVSCPCMYSSAVPPKGKTRRVPGLLRLRQRRPKSRSEYISPTTIPASSLHCTSLGFYNLALPPSLNVTAALLNAGFPVSLTFAAI
jgi:hypothetical protein